MFGKVHTLIFIAGAAASLAGEAFIKSDLGHKIAVNTIVTGMKAKDAADAAVSTIKEDAQDIYNEAKAKKEE